MNNEEVYGLLQRLPRRGFIVGRIAAIVLILIATLAIIASSAISADTFLTLTPTWLRTPKTWLWAVPAYILAVASALCSHYALMRCNNAYVVAKNPRVVYWAHAAGRPDLNASIENCRSLVLHLRNGEQLEVGLSRLNMRHFVAWLREANPTIRWGQYDPPAHLPNTGEDWSAEN